MPLPPPLLPTSADDYEGRVRESFEGLRAVIREDAAATLRLTVLPFGAGKLSVSEGIKPHLIVRKVTRRDATSELFTLAINAHGEADICQGALPTHLGPGDAILLDGARDFSVDISGEVRQLILALPRSVVAHRHPDLLKRAGLLLNGDDASVQLVTQTATLIARQLPRLDLEAQSHAFAAMLDLLGVLSRDRALEREGTGQRFRRAVADIEARLGDPELGAALIAGLQGITRRRLDAIFAERCLTVERFIWDRRLERIAEEITGASRSRETLLDLALRWGFSSEAHFSRRFRAKFGMSPSRYRELGRAGGGG